MAEQFPQYIPPVSNNASSTSKGGNMTVFLDTAPYPEVKGSHDPVTVAMLKEDYAGAVSELTAITMYIFQNTRSTENDSFANAMLQIAIVEMIHLDKLGDAIVALGGRPSFDNGKLYWQAGLVNYAVTMPDMLRADIQLETSAIEDYEKHAAATKNQSVRALLNRIIQDERLHLRFFEETLKSLS